MLNPDSGLESLPAMDVDPSATPQTEISTKATDLTASDSRLEPLPAFDVDPHATSQTKIITRTSDLTSSDPRLDSLPTLDVNPSAASLEEIISAMDVDHFEASQKEMDVDPGSAARIKIITRTTDLTGFEHACGTLNDPRKESTTFRSSANSEVQHMWCEICNVSCNSKKSLERHILGKKHLKNLKNSEKIQAPPSTHIASMAITPITKLEGNLRSTEGNIVDSEVEEGGIVDSEVEEGEIVPSEVEEGEIVDSVIEEGEIVHSEEVKSAFSELGKLSWSNNVLINHASGKENMKKLQKSEKKPDLPSTPITSLLQNPKSVRCELCGIHCNSYDDLNKHISGQKHQKNIRKSEELFGPSLALAPTPAAEKGSLQDPKNEKGKVVIPDGCKRKINSSLAGDEDPDTKKQMVMKEEKASGSTFTCKVCNVVYDNTTAWVSHVVSKKHTITVLRQVNIDIGSSDEEEE